jgi:hypothetical protein
MWSRIMWLSLKHNIRNYYINKDKIKLSLLTDIKYGYVFRIKLAIIKSIPDILLAPNTLIVKHLNYHMHLITFLWTNIFLSEPYDHRIWKKTQTHTQIHKEVIRLTWCCKCVTVSVLRTRQISAIGLLMAEFSRNAQSYLELLIKITWYCTY